MRARYYVVGYRGARGDGRMGLPRLPIRVVRELVGRPGE
jgi:hypothetical protein